jgi:hypothetical protein
LRSWQPPCVSTVSDQPRASACAALEAAASDVVTSLRHEAVRLAPFERTLLRRLDGSLDRTELTKAISAPESIGEPELRVQQVLRWLAVHGLLMQ